MGRFSSTAIANLPECAMGRTNRALVTHSNKVGSMRSAQPLLYSAGHLAGLEVRVAQRLAHALVQHRLRLGARVRHRRLRRAARVDACARVVSPAVMAGRREKPYHPETPSATGRLLATSSGTPDSCESPGCKITVAILRGPT